MRRALTMIAALLIVLCGRARAVDTGLVTIATSIPAGTNRVTVTGFEFAAIPSNVVCTVSAPTQSGVGSYLLFATPILATITTNSLSVALSGHTDTNYTLTTEVSP